MGQHIAKFRVSAELIVQALAMPDNSILYDITQDDSIPYNFVFYVEHPDLPETPDGTLPMEITPLVTADCGKRPSMWLTFDWGIDK